MAIHTQLLTPVSIAEEILQLANLAFSSSEINNAGAVTDPFVLYNAKNRMQDLCSKLLQGVLGRLEYTVLLAESCQESSALGFVNSLSIPDIIGDETVPLEELGEKTGADVRFLAIAMSCLAKHDYFEEVGGFGTQMYKNNSNSEILREGHPESVKDAVGFICDEGFKATSYLLEASKPPANGQENRVPAVNIAFGFENSVFKWMSDQAWRGKRMGKAMQQLHRMANGNVVVDYPWNKLASPVVDIGGGIGSLEMALVKDERSSSLKFIIFDIPTTIENAKITWKSQPAIVSARISFVPGNFLAPSLHETHIPQGQPTYLIRHVLHDWTDEQVVTILKNVREAMLATPSSDVIPKLVLCEMLLRELSPRFVRTTSMQLLALNNGVTRTEAEMVRLVEKAGFEVEKVHHMRSVDSIVEARPV